jgi:hypothetical protein
MRRHASLVIARMFYNAHIHTAMLRAASFMNSWIVEQTDFACFLSLGRLLHVPCGDVTSSAALVLSVFYS